MIAYVGEKEENEVELLVAGDGWSLGIRSNGCKEESAIRADIVQSLRTEILSGKIISLTLHFLLFMIQYLYAIYGTVFNRTLLISHV